MTAVETTATHFDIRKVTSNIGAEVQGIDLSDELDGDARLAGPRTRGSTPVNCLQELNWKVVLKLPPAPGSTMTAVS